MPCCIEVLTDEERIAALQAALLPFARAGIALMNLSPGEQKGLSLSPADFIRAAEVLRDEGVALDLPPEPSPLPHYQTKPAEPCPDPAGEDRQS